MNTEADAFLYRIERDNAEDFASEIADDLRILRKRHDVYGLALMMIREGCDSPSEVALAAINKARAIIAA